jgi:hypothetical protein
MPGTETQYAARLTPAQSEILNFVSTKGQASIDEFRDRIDDLRMLIARGYLRLSVEVYEWGVSFEVFPNTEYALIPAHIQG